MSKKASSMGVFERFLTLWVAICIAAGVGLGFLIPSAFSALASFEYASVNFAVAVLIWVMIYPMMVNVDFHSIKDVGKKPKGLCITVVVNWLIKPFTMVGLGILFFKVLLVDFVQAETAREYIAGMILLGVTDIVVPSKTLLLSVVLYVVVPLAAGFFTRTKLLKKQSSESVASFMARLKLFSIVGLLATVVLLFGFQAKTIIAQPFVILLIAIPLVIQSYGIFALAYGWAYLWRVPFSTAAPAALIGTSNFFELAVAVAISLFGLESGAALATVVGVLVEVPVMLSLVSIANRTKSMFPILPMSYR